MTLLECDASHNIIQLRVQVGWVGNKSYILFGTRPYLFFFFINMSNLISSGEALSLILLEWDGQ